eukprot:GFUD01000006.1.p1 GENE.GFUD01000006.1~~GFUD01000006.1.p1  ORF type:complete len:537 (+),score=129.45 GFUD01000006.1:71-1681(+)
MWKDAMDLADLLECSICLEQLNESNKVLPCQHTFCTQCLKDIFKKKSELICPECRKPVDVSIDSLPPNILANRILEGMNNAKTKSETKLLEPTKVQPALPFPKRPSSKLDTAKKPPAPTPEEAKDGYLKSQNYQNISSQAVPAPPRMSGSSSQGYNNVTPIKVPSQIPPNPVAQMVLSQPGSINFTGNPSSLIQTKTSPQADSPMLLSPTHAPIPGNHSTNPFIDLIDSSPHNEKQKENSDISQSFSILQIFPKKGSTSSKAPQPEPRIHKNVLTTTNDQNLIQSLPLPAQPAPKPPLEPPRVPERPKHTLGLETTKLWQLSPRALIDPPVSISKENPSTSHFSGTLYRALYDYNSTQHDELSLKKGDLYFVTEQCHDGWFKGKSLKSGKSGVFPGNHVQEHDHKQTKKSKRKESVNVHEVNLIDLSDEEHRAMEEEYQESDAERLEKLKKIRDTLRQTHQQNVVRSQAGAAGHVKSKGERYRCVVAFPASSEYEIDLQHGDVISLVKRRDDGWCKGTLHRTGKTGLFPASFVEKI